MQNNVFAYMIFVHVIPLLYAATKVKLFWNMSFNVAAVLMLKVAVL